MAGIVCSDIIIFLLFTMFYVLHEVAQRFALAAGGRDEIRFESRKNSKPEKCLKTAQNPTSRLHALLGNLLAYQNDV
jgi:hypothetical protein